MKYLKHLILSCVILALHSCSEDPEPELPVPETPQPGTFLTISLAADHEYVDRMWGFVTDSQGKVIASQKLHAGINELHGEAPDIINLTLLQCNSDFCAFDTYANVAVDSIITLVPPHLNWYYAAPPITGYVLVDITNFMTANFDRPVAYVSDEYGGSVYDPAGPYGNDPTLLYIHKPSTDILVSAFSQDNTHPVYAWINGVMASDRPSLDFADLKPFDHTITLPKGGSVRGHLAGYKTMGEDKQYRVFSGITLEGAPDSTPPSKLGYLEGYDEYETMVQATNRLPSNMARFTTYRKFGTINPNVVLLDNEMTIVNRMLPSFNYTYSGNSPLQIHGFLTSIDGIFVWWDIYSDGLNFPVFTDLPANIKAEFPFLHLNLGHSSSKFYHFTDGYSYERFFTDFQAGNYPLINNPEYYELEFAQY